MTLYTEIADIGDNTLIVKIGSASWSAGKPLHATGLSPGQVSVLGGEYRPGSQVQGSSINGKAKVGNHWSYDFSVILKTWDRSLTVPLGGFTDRPTITNVAWQSDSTSAVDVSITLDDITDTLTCEATGIAGSLWAKPYREGYNYAGTQVNLTGTTITVPTSYFSAANTAGYGTHDYTLAAEGYSGGVKAIVKDGDTTKISTNCSLTLTIPTNLDENGAATVEVTSGSGDDKVTVKSGPAVTLYNNGYKAGWAAALAALTTTATLTTTTTNGGTVKASASVSVDTSQSAVAGVSSTIANNSDSDSKKLNVSASGGSLSLDSNKRIYLTGSSTYAKVGAESSTDSGYYKISDSHSLGSGTEYWYRRSGISVSGTSASISWSDPT